jgi:predicted  nucleic acid-binding Zn-ribbon protein
MPPTPGNDVVSALQRQIKTLADDNQELRTKLRELQEQLSESKQLLADKVLELSRLKAKPGTGKPKAQAPNGR